MKDVITAECLNNLSKLDINFEVELPKVCPRCNSAWMPRLVSAVYVDQDGYYRMDATLFCTKCEYTSVAVYYGSNSNNIYHKEKRPIDFMTIYPKALPEIDKFPEIQKKYPDFWNIYIQALAADSYDLPDVCGVGLRKALEFLVKEYAISNNPDDKETIEDMNLSACIGKYIQIPKIKELANRAVWLGNDQTHYLNKHGLGLQDLKRLTDLVLHYIEMEVEAESAINEIVKL